MKRNKLTILILLVSLNLMAQDDVVNTGNLQIHAGASFVFIGDFTNNGTYVDAGTVVLDGAVEQILNGSGSISFNNLTIDNSSATGVVLSGGNVNVAGTLTLTDGLVYTNSSNLLILADNATISGGSTGSYVLGPLRKTGNDAFTFHIGKAGYYMPIGITAPGTNTDVFTAEYFRADPNAAYGSTKDAALNKVSNNEYWTLVQNTGTTSENVTLQWSGNTSNIGNLSELRVASWNGSQWDNLGNGSTTGSTSAGTIQSSSTTSAYTAFTFGTTTTNNPLPITLLNFNAVLNNKQVDLVWITGSEINNDFFTVEKTKDGKHFEFVAMVEGAGTSYQKLYYSSVDSNPYDGISYYRLKQTNFDGGFSYSGLVPISLSNEKIINMFPNPAPEGNVILHIQNNGDPIVTVDLMDINGRVLQSNEYKVLKNQSLNIRFDDLTKGIYMVRISGKSGTTNKKLIIN
ncbi:MAG: T9SS type A sorting domain-containing protein [Bacteroidia bacterium]